MSTPAVDPIIVDKMRAMRLAGKTLREIAEANGYSSATSVWRYVNDVKPQKVTGRMKAALGRNYPERQKLREEGISLKWAVLESLTIGQAETPGVIQMRVSDAFKRQLDNRSVDQHNIVHVLHSLNKQGFVRFQQSNAHNKSQSILSGIRITDAGRSALKRKGSMKGFPTTKALARSTTAQIIQGNVGGEQARHQTDATDFRNHAAVAQGGPIERVYRDVSAEQARVEETAPPPTTANHPWYAEPWTGQRGDVLHDLPLLKQLEARTTKVQAAANLLREAGMEDEAGLVEAGIKFTAFEEQVLELIKRARR